VSKFFIDVTDIHAVLMWSLPHTLAHVNSSTKFALNILDRFNDLVFAITPRISAHGLCDRMSFSWLLLFLNLMLVQSLLFDYMWLFWLNLFFLFDLKSRNRVFLYPCASSDRKVQRSNFFVWFIIFILSLGIFRWNLKLIGENTLVFGIGRSLLFLFFFFFLLWYFVLMSNNG